MHHQSPPYHQYSHEHLDIENSGPMNYNMAKKQRNTAVMMKDPFGPSQRPPSSQYSRAPPIFVVPESYMNWRNQFQFQQQMGFHPVACQHVDQYRLPVPHVPHTLPLGHKRAYTEAGKALPSARSVLGHEMMLPIRNSKTPRQTVNATVDPEEVLEAADILSTFHL